MACIVKRGSRSAPRYYVKHQPLVGAAFMRLLPGVVNKDQAADELARIKRELAAGRDPFPDPVAAPDTIRSLMADWAEGLTNRNAGDDRSRITRHLRPRFGSYTIEQLDLPAVMEWIRDLSKSDLSGQSQRHLLNLLSRFFSWAIDGGHAMTNPVKMVPMGKRPVAVLDVERPWLEDDSKVPELFAALGPLVGLMFYLGNRSGMRPGEVAGLRISDLEFLDEGIIRVAHSYGGPLKEDKKGEGKLKWVPAPLDAEDVLRLHLKRRQLQGAKANDLVFLFTPDKPQNRRRTSEWRGYRKEYLAQCWDRAAKACKVKGLTFYEATRHSFVSRNLKAGISLDEVSAAVGHSSPAVTKRFYARYVRKTFNPALRQGLNG
jgi:integrase